MTTLIDNPVTEIEDTVSQSVQFMEPIAGFEAERGFAMAPLDPAGVLYTLRSEITPGLRFLVMPPQGFFPGYNPEIDERDVESLGDLSEADLQLLVIVSVTNGIADATANLLAPIVLDTRSGRAVQVVLADSGLPLNAPLAS